MFNFKLMLMPLKVIKTPEDFNSELDPINYKRYSLRIRKVSGFVINS